VSGTIFSSEEIRYKALASDFQVVAQDPKKGNLYFGGVLLHVSIDSGNKTVGSISLIRLGLMVTLGRL